MIEVYAPESVWPVDSEYATAYLTAVESGERAAAITDAVIVGIARDAMPHLTNTLKILDVLSTRFRSCLGYVFENDSTDQTGQVLDEFAAGRTWFHVEREALGHEDTRGFERSRTERLAEYRNRCLEWVRENAADTAWTIVLDLDPHHGFSVDGVMTSVHHLAAGISTQAIPRPGGMASYSLYRHGDRVAHYDAYAARPVCYWRDNRASAGGYTWFSAFLPPVGSMPQPMNSAFGGLAVYHTPAYLKGRYSGEDCEHVTHHRRMRQEGYQMFLNPGCRYIAVWQE